MLASLWAESFLAFFMLLVRYIISLQLSYLHILARLLYTLGLRTSNKTMLV